MDLYPFDDEYLRRLRAGHRETQEHFVRYCREFLGIKLRRRLSAHDAVEDVIQETVTRVWARLGEVRDAHKLGAFVNTTCNHALQERYRDNARAARTDAGPASPEDPHDVERELIEREVSARIRRILNRMDPRERQILDALFLEELPKDEVCRRFGVDRNYLRVLLFRAKAKFRGEFARKSTPPHVLVTIGGPSSLSH